MLKRHRGTASKFGKRALLVFSGTVSRTFMDQSHFPGLARAWKFDQNIIALLRTFQEV